MALSVVSGGGGQLYGTGFSNPQVNQYRNIQNAGSLHVAPISSGNFTNTYNPQNGGAAVLGLQTSSPAAPTAPTGPTQAQIDEANRLAAARQQYGDPSQYDSQINNDMSQIGGLQAQQDVGLQNVNDQYQTQYNRTNDSRAGDERNYNTGVQQNTQSYQNNRTKVLNSTRANANALQRLLGINGAGNSSAAYEQAPYAAALQGSQDIGDAQQTFGQNAQNLDNNWQDTQRKYKNAFDDLATQKYQGENGVRANVASSRVKLLQDLAAARTNRNLASGVQGPAANVNDYQPEINSLLSQITQWGRANPNPVLAAQSVSATPVQLSDYAQGRRLVAQNQPTPGGNDIGPNFLPIVAGKRDQFGNPIMA